MSKKRNAKKILQNADEKTVRRIADSYPAVDEKKKKELYSRIEQRVKMCTDDEYADRVSGVEVLRSSAMMRYLTTAAALVLVIGGGTLAISRMGTAPNVYSDIENETVEEITDGEFTEEGEKEYFEDIAEEPADEENVLDFTLTVDSYPANFDMTTKEGILGKMINSSDYFDKASGRFLEP